MNEMNDKWINDIRSRMDNYSEPLPAGLWEKIESEMSAPAPKVIPLWKKWTSVAAAAALVLAVSTVSVWLWNKDSQLQEANSVLSDNREVMQKIQEEGIALADNVVAKEQVEPLLARTVGKTENTVNGVSQNIYTRNSTNIVEPVSDNNMVSASDNDVTSVSDNNLAEDNVKVESDENIEKEFNSATTAKNEVSAHDMRRQRAIADRETARRNASYLAMSDRKKGKSGGLQLGLNTGNIPYSSSNTFSGMSRLATPTKSVNQVNDVVVGEVSDATASYSQVLFNNRGMQTYTDIKHYMPVTFGASVKWNLNDDWALESGLNYTYLYSELRSGAKSYIEEKQKLHYIGIPLKVQRSIWSNNVFSFYASAGGMVEKCVSGSVETVCVDEDNSKNLGSEKIDAKPFQFSALASVGMQANFNKLLSVFVEPGMAYYFDDNTEILTIRKDKPFNFNLQLGLRFNLNR